MDGGGRGEGWGGRGEGWGGRGEGWGGRGGGAGWAKYCTCQQFETKKVTTQQKKLQLSKKKKLQLTQLPLGGTASSPAQASTDWR